MLDLLTPTDHVEAFEWAAVYLAHLFIGLALTALVTAVGSMGTAGVYVGGLNSAGTQAFDGPISDILIFNAFVLSNATYKAAFLAYFDREYGL